MHAQQRATPEPKRWIRHNAFRGKTGQAHRDCKNPPDNAAETMGLHKDVKAV